MYLLKKVIQLREKSHPDHEKPFLEHLEDLRVMITRIVITLLIAMIVCFTYNNQLMAFFRRPVEQVLVTQMEATLPKDKDVPRQLTTDLWKEALKVEHSVSALTPEQREVYFRFLHDENLAFHAKSVGLLRAAMNLPEERRENFVESLNEDSELKKQIHVLLKTKPNTESQLRGNLNMMSALKPTEGFMLSMKLAFVAGIVVSFPLLLLYILQFVLPGLHSHEKRVLWPAMAVGFGLFLFGAAFAYYLVLPRALMFFYTWSGDMGISNDWRIGEYISFATQFTLLFGVSFELPVVVMVFVKLGLLTYDTMSRTRSYAIVGIFVAAAILTPTPDIPTMLLMASPMIILYEICIWLAYFDRKKTRLAEEQEAREREERLALTNSSAAAGPAAEYFTDAVEPHADEGGGAYHTYDAEDSGEVGETGLGREPEETGDDGWTGDFPQQEFHDDPELPEPPRDSADDDSTPDPEKSGPQP
jgi:sec-independent protein translocase protein TatC